MKLRNLFDAFKRRKQSDISAAARAMRLKGVESQEALKRARVDAMRAQAGLPAWEWRS